MDNCIITGYFKSGFNDNSGVNHKLYVMMPFTATDGTELQLGLSDDGIYMYTTNYWNSEVILYLTKTK